MSLLSPFTAKEHEVFVSVMCPATGVKVCKQSGLRAARECFGAESANSSGCFWLWPRAAPSSFLTSAEICVPLTQCERTTLQKAGISR